MELLTIWTVGHSNRTLEQFVELLKPQSIELVADVRRFPGSRRLPHFNFEPFSQSLAEAGIGYRHYEELGGRRKKALEPSPNNAWRNASFRAYADFMMTEEFRDGIARLLAMAKDKRTAIMCSEALWWRCHRALIADYLKAAGHRVLHIMSPTKVDEHPFTSAAKILNGKLSYALEGEPQFLF